LFLISYCAGKIFMKQHFTFLTGSRVLIIAPHPDDEALATGGLLQHVSAAGGESRVIFLTDGENNPWPQRISDRRWLIRASDRKRWAILRRIEAITALQELGVPESSTRFWGFPDQGLTDLLLKADDEIPQHLIREFRDWQPSVLITPSPLDLHPDHSAAAVFARLALARSGNNSPLHFEYRVHKRWPNPAIPCLTLDLSMEQKELKRRAIMCHASQLRLRPSLLKFALPTEEFISPEEIRYLSYHPLQQVSITSGNIELCLELSRCIGAFGRATLYLASHRSGHLGARLSLILPLRGSAVIDVRDAAQGSVVAQARFRGGRRRFKLQIPLSSLGSTDFVFAKVERRFGFFDEAGWCEFSIHPSQSHQ
jgi:LmbE family N-acetylglucosaminyl deacetylase